MGGAAPAGGVEGKGGSRVGWVSVGQPQGPCLTAGEKVSLRPRVRRVVAAGRLLLVVSAWLRWFGGCVGLFAHALRAGVNGVLQGRGPSF